MALFNFLKKVQQAVRGDSDSSAQPRKSHKYRPEEPPVPEGAPAADCYAFRGTVEEYFRQLISGCFPQLRIFPNEYLGGTNNIPVSFLLYQDGQPKLAVILCDARDYRTAYVQNTVDACNAEGIPVQRYYRNFRNKATYVTERIRSVL